MPPDSVPGMPYISPAAREFIVAVSIFVVVWFTNMAVTGWLAGRKGRESGLWAVRAFFSGPIALVAILLASRLERGADADLDALVAATAKRVRLKDDSQLELDVAGRLAQLRGRLAERIKGRPSFRLARSTEWQWSDGSPMTDEERAQLRREVPHIGTREGWVLTLDADDLR